ncbi:hypothetical protein PLEOSDRAFT_1110162 [Pleurotus ostreatus PC15]|uniref:Uncharacterized protein n=1 Tax=Pleurotus ostreatus (strain PC15) TaxID=1137138 RepID=A0A067NWM9_PLEO1|nr:hypothetical protein PLEOSDRAFT_1110162 [Pleurotus ostreatus PC15]
MFATYDRYCWFSALPLVFEGPEYALFSEPSRLPQRSQPHKTSGSCRALYPRPGRDRHIYATFSTPAQARDANDVAPFVCASHGTQVPTWPPSPSFDMRWDSDTIAHIDLSTANGNQTPSLGQLWRVPSVHGHTSRPHVWIRAVRTVPSFKVEQLDRDLVLWYAARWNRHADDHGVPTLQEAA